jgi:predicted unusual protein kinase regulating ubiquinone biosynthesis (AarF/ABC1/UbiB family)
VIKISQALKIELDLLVEAAEMVQAMDLIRD